MKFQELVSFLKSFNISENKIKEFTNQKTLRIINNNIYLIDDKNKLVKNQIHDDILVFIKLKKLLPSKFLLKFIQNNSNNILDIISEKDALQYTYGKNMSLNKFNNNQSLKNNSNYIITHKNNILGYSHYINKNLKNQMNIGEYLKEN